MRTILASLLVASMGLVLVSCRTAPPPVDLKSVLNGTFVYSGPTASVKKTIKLVLNSGSMSFKYSEMGGIQNNSYNGKFMILGDTVVFTNSDKQTVKHKVAKTASGFKLTYVENDNPVSFAFEPIGSANTFEFFKQ